LFLLILGIIVSYCLGSFPSAYILGKRVKGSDVRKLGSGNVGATNLYRLAGWLPALTALLLDILKGFLAVGLIAQVFLRFGLPFADNRVRALFALAVICGHDWSIFLGFKGGKGVATTLGILLGFSLFLHNIIYIIMLCLLIWISTLAMFKYVSLSSIVAALSIPVLGLIFPQPTEIVTVSAIIAFLIVLKHKSNIYRLLREKEPKISFLS
jgi:glycerol-3-phosphate acyltransferase PlsY